MKICEKCGNGFPGRIKIDGKERNLKNRKFCLNCSPFGKHNTRYLDNTAYSNMEVIKVTCKSCSRDYLYIFKTKSGHTLTECNSCIQKRRNVSTKIKSVKYLGGKCQVCDYDKDMSALEFHHIDPEKKEFGIGSGRNRSWENLKKELDKCKLLCCRCHREVHSGLIILAV